MVNKLFRFFTVFDLFYYFFVLFLFKRNFFTHVILFTFPTKAYILYIIYFCLLQPDYDAQTLMEEAKFRQQLEQRSKRSEKKHGKQTADFLNTLTAHAWAAA